MSERTIGTCSICGGAVTVPQYWLGIHPPTPSCSTCGAMPVLPHGPVIPMRPRQPTWSPTWRTVPPIFEPAPVVPDRIIDYDARLQNDLLRTKGRKSCMNPS